jgi:hypothetical protein
MIKISQRKKPKFYHVYYKYKNGFGSYIAAFYKYFDADEVEKQIKESQKIDGRIVICSFHQIDKRSIKFIETNSEGGQNDNT